MKEILKDLVAKVYLALTPVVAIWGFGIAADLLSSKSDVMVFFGYAIIVAWIAALYYYILAVLFEIKIYSKKTKTQGEQK